MGTYNNQDIRFNTNNASGAYSALKQKMIIASGGNVGISYDGTNSPTSPQNKLLVQNGGLGYNPYTITSGLGITSSSIGIASFSKNMSNDVNIPILSYGGFTPATFSGSTNIGIATIANNAENNIGTLIIGGSNSTLSNNIGVNTQITGNGASGNSGMRVNLSGNGTPANFGIKMDINGTWSNPVLTQNTGIHEVVSGDGRMDGDFDPASTFNKGLHFEITGETTRNLGAVLLVGGDSSNNTGISSHVYGATSQPNIGVWVQTHGSSTWNNGVYGAVYGNNTNNTGVMGEVRNGASDNFPPLQTNNANSVCIGVKGSISNQADGSQNYGVVGDLSAITNPQNNIPYYAIYGIMPSSGSSSPTPGASVQPRYAGYFNGDVFCANTYYYSDLKLKNNIQEYTGALDQIGKISVKSYEFANKEYPYMNMPQGIQFGLLSNEIKEIFPNLVKQAVQPETKTTPRVDFETVNYVGLVPILVEAVNELNKKVSAKQDSVKKSIELLKADNEKLYKKIEELNDIISNICKTGCESINSQVSTIDNSYPILYQNSPNPFSSETTIRYHIPYTFQSAYILISNLSGIEVKRLIINNSEQNQFIISANTFSSGTYLYTLFIDGKPIDTKKMILTQQ